MKLPVILGRTLQADSGQFVLERFRPNAADGANHGIAGGEHRIQVCAGPHFIRKQVLDDDRLRSSSWASEYARTVLPKIQDGFKSFGSDAEFVSVQVKNCQPVLSLHMFR